MIRYKFEKTIDTSEFISLLNNSTLGERRPVDDVERISLMLKNSNLIITARDDGKLIGIARCVTDFGFCTYLSDLAVEIDYQSKGIGKELLRQSQLAVPQAKLILLSAPKAIGYYPKVGMIKYNYCYYFDSLKD